MREQERQRKGRERTPSAAMVDSQSIKIAEQRGWRGYDGGKKIHGRKQHLLVDTEGLVLKAIVSPAHITDRTGAEVLLEQVASSVPRLAKIWADYSYRGKFVEWVRERFGWDLEIVTHRLPRHQRRLGEGGNRHRLGSHSAWRLPCASQEVGRGANFWLDLPFAATSHGL
jgi:putative transposase